MLLSFIWLFIAVCGAAAIISVLMAKKVDCPRCQNSFKFPGHRIKCPYCKQGLYKTKDGSVKVAE